MVNKPVALILDYRLRSAEPATSTRSEDEAYDLGHLIIAMSSTSPVDGDIEPRQRRAGASPKVSYKLSGDRYGRFLRGARTEV